MEDAAGPVLFITGFLVVIVIAITIPVYYGRRASVRNAFINQQRQRMAWLQSIGFVISRFYRRVLDVGRGVMMPYDYLLFDFEHGLAVYDRQLVRMSDVYEVKLLKESTVVESATSRMGGGAVAGLPIPAVAGWGGESSSSSTERTAIVAVQILTTDPAVPGLTIPFLWSVVDRASVAYRDAVSTATDVYGIFASAIHRAQEEAAHPVSTIPAVAPTRAAGTCPKCGSAHSAGATFCSSCGAALAALTPEQAEHLGELTRLRDSGLLTADEFATKRDQLLGG